MDKGQIILDDWKMSDEKKVEKLQNDILNLPINHERRDQQRNIHQEVFTEIDCLACGNCCRTTPPILTKKDVKRIAQFLSITTKAFIHKYLIEDVDGTMVGIKVPCYFLNQDNTCQIYEVRPKACRQYPHTDDQEVIKRIDLHQENVVICPATMEIFKRLIQRLEPSGK